MAKQNPTSDEQERIRRGQSAALGDTGDGRTGVPAGEQGISNRPGDTGVASDADATEGEDDEPDDDAPDDDVTTDVDVEDDDEDDEDDEDEEDGEDEDEDEDEEAADPEEVR
jgi:hypothetical protein